jgi:hypothetical protein
MDYLTAWKSSIPAAQRKWIEQLVTQKKQDQTLTDSQASIELNRLISLLAQGDTLTISELFLGVIDELVYAEANNLMIDGMTGDIIAAFQEALNLGLLQDTCERLYQQRIITELRTALSNLEQTAQHLALLSNSSSSFNKSINGNFSQKSSYTPRSDALADLLYRDPRTKLPVPMKGDCIIDDLANALTLPLSYHDTQQIESISIISKSLAYGQGGDNLKGTSLGNLIDQENDTYWIYQEVASQAAPDGLNIKLEFDLGGAPTFSIVELQPVANYPYKVSSLTYENMLGQETDLFPLISSAVQEQLSRPIRFHFTECQGRKLNLGLQQPSYKRLPSKEVRYTYNSPGWPFDAPAPSPGRTDDVEVCVYSLGLDNVIIGTALYSDIGIYVSPKLEVEQCVMIGLDTKEVWDDRRISIEYYILKQDLNSMGRIIQTRVVPILPLSQREVVNETMIFTGSSNSIIPNVDTPRFCAHLDNQLLDVKIYEEARQMGTTEYRAIDPFTSQNPSRIAINNPGPNMYYTMDYSPTHLNVMTAVYLNDKQDLWYAGTNTLQCATQVDGRDIAKSNIYAIVIMRQNPRHSALTPQVNRYQLLAASAASKQSSGV